MADSVWHDSPPRRLGEVLRVKHGYAFKGEYFAEQGNFIVLTPGNFHDEGGYKPKTGAEKYYRGPIPEGFLLNKGDLVLAMTEQTRGLIGSSALIPEDGVYLHNQRIGLVELIVPEEAELRYLYYLFNTPAIRDQIQATATGSKVRHTAPSRIEAIKVKLPPRLIQQSISQALGLFDELIENNSRRIAILERTARFIYLEWFVNLRFPGYESLQVLEGVSGSIPKGWESARFGDIASEIRDGVHPNELDPTATHVGLEHLPRRSVVLAEWGEASEVASRKWRFTEGDILFGKLRPYFHKVACAPGEGICSTDVIVIRAHEDFQEFALLIASSSRFVAHAVGGSGGTDRPRANWSDLAAYPILLPPSHTLHQFRENLQPLIKLMFNLTKQNAILRTTRELLLPGLVSGEIELTDTRLETEPAA